MQNNLDIITNLLHANYNQTERVLIEVFDSNTNLNDKMKIPIHVHSHDIKYELFRFENKKNIELFPYFANQSGIKKMCDYIIFGDYRNQFFAIAIELKRGGDPSSKQLNAAKCFIEFIVNTAKRIGHSLPEKVNIYKVRIKEPNPKSNKRTTKRTKLPKNTDEVFLYPSNWKTFWIDEIITS